MQIATGEVTGKGYQHRSAVECKKFLALMGKSVPGIPDVHRILDNCRTYKTALIDHWRWRSR